MARCCLKMCFQEKGKIHLNSLQHSLCIWNAQNSHGASSGKDLHLPLTHPAAAEEKISRAIVQLFKWGAWSDQLQLRLKVGGKPASHLRACIWKQNIHKNPRRTSCIVWIWCCAPWVLSTCCSRCCLQGWIWGWQSLSYTVCSSEGLILPKIL